MKGSMKNPMKTSTLIQLFSLLASAAIVAACSNSPAVNPNGRPELSFPSEKRIKNLRQLTAGGTNAEAYWSFDGRSLSYQHKGHSRGDNLPPEVSETASCDQIYTMRADGSDFARVSGGKGRTTCSYYVPSGERVLFSSTAIPGNASTDQCPPEPDKSKGYLWPIYDTYQIYSGSPKPKTGGFSDKDVYAIEPGAPRAYNAEATVCSDGSVVFTSDRNGDLDLFVGHLDTRGLLTDIKQVTNILGYDGGAFFSSDCKKLIWRASRPKPGPEADEYKAFLKKHLVKPSALELWIGNADGTDAHQITRLGVASFAPFLTPDAKSVLFASNLRDPRGRGFDIYMIDVNGTHLEQVTHSGLFDSFPMFSPDGKYVAFSSNRNGKEPRETNVFVADWVPRAQTPLTLDEPDAADRYQALIDVLASSEFEGRGLGTNGLAKAVDLVAARFEKLGLTSIKGQKEFKLGLPVITGVSPKPDTAFSVADHRFELHQSFEVLPFSASGKVSGDVVDVGYGLGILDLKIDDYEGKNVKGKVVLVHRHAPENLKLTREQDRTYTDLRYKAFLAREHGAKAILFWDDKDPASKDGTNGALVVGGSHPGEATHTGDAGILAGLVASDAVDALKKAKKVTLNFDLEVKTETAHNVVGAWGKGCKTSQPIVIGAHLDHLGFGGRKSLANEVNAIHPGADDNASGVASIIEAARIIMQSKDAAVKKGCYWFAAYSHTAMRFVAFTACLYMRVVIQCWCTLIELALF